MYKEFLEKDEYFTNDPFIKDIIDEEIRREIMKNTNNVEEHVGRGRRGKSSQEQALLNLKNSENKFRYITS
jgi:hypothetical protein